MKRYDLGEGGSALEKWRAFLVKYNQRESEYSSAIF